MEIQQYIVSKDESIYEAWPDIVKTNSGRLVCVFSECEHHIDRTNARLMICTSDDKGRTWTKKRPLTGKGKSEDYYNCARISKMNDGRLAIICDKVTGGKLGEHERQTVCQHLWFSEDDGETWKAPMILPFCGIVPDKLRQLKNGRMLVCAHFKNFETNKLEQYLWYSDDEGKSWSDKIVVASDSRYNLCEVSILECENNTLIAFLRENSFEGHNIMKAISYNNGETWEGVYDTPMSGGHRPTSGFLQDGSVLVTYRFIPSIPRSMRNVFGSILNRADLLNKQKAEQGIITFPIAYDRNERPDLGYTGWVQFDDGEIYVVNYIKDDSEKAYIRGYSFYTEDFILRRGE